AVRKERGGADQDAASAVAALGSLLGEKGLLKRMLRVGPCEALHGGDALAFHRPQRCIAGGGGGAVDENEAGTAHSGAAPEPRALQREVVAERVKERRVRFGLDRALRAVDRQVNAIGHGFPGTGLPSRSGLPRISPPWPTSGCPAR